MKPFALTERGARKYMRDTSADSTEWQYPTVPVRKPSWRIIAMVVVCACLLLGTLQPAQTQAEAPSGGTTIGSFTVVDGPVKITYLPFVCNPTINDLQKTLYLPYVLSMTPEPGTAKPGGIVESAERIWQGFVLLLRSIAHRTTPLKLDTIWASAK